METLPEIGTVCDGTVVTSLVFVRDLEYFEGPILTQHRSPDGVPYLEKWATCTQDSPCLNRSVYVRSSDEAIAAYLDRRITLLDLLTKPNGDEGILVDDVRGEAVRFAAVTVSSLPEKYLPRPHARHDPRLRLDEGTWGS